MQEDPNDQHNIVRMTDQCFFRQHYCFVFELLHTDLFEHLKATGFVGFSTDKIKDYAIQILKGLVFLEKHKLIHCDLKPENILIKSYSRCEIKVIDFGSSCFIHDHLSSYVQSRSYRAPEVILGQAADNLRQCLIQLRQTPPPASARNPDAILEHAISNWAPPLHRTQYP